MFNNLLKHLPFYYRTSKVMQNITNSDDVEITNFKSEITNTLNQFFVDTADFTLERWEKELGIPTNNAGPIGDRRSVIKSKLRGVGTVKVSLIKNVAESFVNGTVDVIENNPDYSFIVKFVDTRGIPPNLDDVKKAIEDIKPAHLQVVFEYTYLIWNELDAENWTWDELDALAFTWDSLQVYRP